MSLLSAADVFVPNTTTTTLFESALPVTGLDVLDMGCGVGPIAIASALGGAKSVVGVDVMEEACQLARRNAELNSVADRVTIVRSHAFRDLGEDKKFDVIISDAAGMSEEIARRSPWYPGSIPTGGVDGTAVAVEVVENAPRYLRPGGRLVFPVLSLSRAARIETAAQRAFGDGLTKVAEKSIPFPPDLAKDRAWLEAQQKQGLIDYTVRGSRLCWRLTIYSGQRA